MRPDVWLDNQYTALPGDPFTENTPLDPPLLRELGAIGMLFVPREW